jgi:hypothetical protein
MNQHVQVWFACLLLVTSACERDQVTGIGDAAPIVGEYERALERLDEVVDALAVGSSTPEALLAGPEADTIPEEALANLNRIGETAARVTFSVQNERSAPPAVTLALADTAARVRTYLTTAAGAVGDGPSVVLPPPHPIRVNVTSSEEGLRQRQEGASPAGGSKERRLRGAVAGLEQDQEVDLVGLLYVALLANPQARASLAPNLSPDDVPEVTPELAEELSPLPVENREDWQAALFDDAGRLVLPTSEEGSRYTLLRAWARVVNEGLAAHVNSLFRIVLHAVVAESQRLERSSG